MKISRFPFEEQLETEDKLWLYPLFFVFVYFIFFIFLFLIFIFITNNTTRINTMIVVFYQRGRRERVKF